MKFYRRGAPSSPEVCCSKLIGNTMLNEFLSGLTQRQIQFFCVESFLYAGGKNFQIIRFNKTINLLHSDASKTRKETKTKREEKNLHAVEMHHTEKKEIQRKKCK